MNAPAPWKARVAAYLAHRRAHGFELAFADGQLQAFARFADVQGPAPHLIVALAAAWARTARRPHPLTWARRIEVLRGFAQYWRRWDPATEIPPRNLFGPAHRRLVPHIFTEAELIALLQATATLTPRGGLRPATCRCVFGLLAASGLRISEALALTTRDVDLTAGVLSIRAGKFQKPRLVPLHPSTTAALVVYARQRDTFRPQPVCDRFFVRDDGRPADALALRYAMQVLCRRLGWGVRGDYPYHRLHDHRHTFIVRSLLRGYERGVAIDHAVLALSTYVGHARITDTYWYLTGIPELMSLAGERFRRYAEEVSS